MALTQKAISDLKLDGKSEKIVFDDKVAGFGVRLREGGARTWIFQYRRKTDNTQRRFTIGKVDFTVRSLDDMRDEARVLAGRVSRGEDPQSDKDEARKPRIETVYTVLFEKRVEEYLTDCKARLRPRSYTEVERHLEKHWTRLHRMKVLEIGKAEIAAELRTIAKASGPAAANRARTTLSGMFSWMVGEDLAEENPVINTNKQTEGDPRERVLSDAELVAIWKATDGATDYNRIIRLLMLTGQRRSEVGGIGDSEIDLEKRIWTCPGERTKNGNLHDIPLSQSALDLLASVPRREDRDMLFGIGKGAFSGWSRCKERLDEDLGIARQGKEPTKGEGKAAAKVEPWTVHDLRRTAVTGMQKLGFPIEVVGAVINHRSGKISGVTGIYARHDYAAEKRQALEMWAAHVEALVSGKRSNVVALKSA
jgi:integrase